VAQINLCSYYLKKGNPVSGRNRIDERFPEDKATVADLVDHIDHAVRIAGVEHGGIGSDFDGGAGLLDVGDVSEMPKTTRELVRRGYSEKDIRRIWGENLMRVFRANRKKIRVSTAWPQSSKTFPD
jgi:microsomal dipeptidase-like Zn-dependent dipeptidase